MVDLGLICSYGDLFYLHVQNKKNIGFGLVYLMHQDVCRVYGYRQILSAVNHGTNMYQSLFGFFHDDILLKAGKKDKWNRWAI